MRAAAGSPARAGRIGLPHILLLALALRLIALSMPSVVHADEIFQYLEPAHRMLFGTGVTTWEWREGIRGRLLPLAIAGPMAIGDAIAPGSGLFLLLPRLAMVVASLSLVTAAWQLGRRLSRLHAVAAATVAACWYEAVYFAPHILSETVAVALILPGAVLLGRGRSDDRRRLLAAGVLLGLAASIRFQYGPAIAVLVLASRWRRPADLLPVVLGGLIGLLPEAIADLAGGDLPYRWLIENVRENIVAGRAARYGVSGPSGLVALTVSRWSLWGIPLLGAAAIGARRYPALAAAAVANFAVHSAIAHKEYRFVLLSTAIVVVLAALGTIDIVRRTARREGAATARNRLRLAALCWALASATLAFGTFRPMWTASGADLAAFADLRRDPGMCGLALYRYEWWRTGGYATLHRDVPMTLFEDDSTDPERDLRAAAPAFDRILAEARHAAELPPGYAPQTCRDTVCVYARAGGCDPRAARGFAIDAVLARNGD